jgi:hypothetical protein
VITKKVVYLVLVGFNQQISSTWILIIIRIIFVIVDSSLDILYEKKNKDIVDYDLEFE